ncbi:MAG: MFS transporter [Rhodospirillaceae bacterium]|nr:MFS transporter [Rhodospirillaceae bacterium]|tara:strand:- start:1761 stop:3200 length:1440 start_codon:yes stop_codon:yes gene_type:complete
MSTVERQKPDWLAGLAVYVQPRVLAVLFLGFSSGLPLALTGATLSAWMTDVGVDLTVIGFFALAGLPYTFKYIWAPLIDRIHVPVLGRRMGHRRAWLIVVQVLLALAILALSGIDPLAQPALTAIIAVIVTFLSASQDIVIDAFRIESLNEDQQGAGAAVYIGGYRVAMLVSGAGALYLAQFCGWDVSYLAMAALMGVGLATVLISSEPARATERGEEEQLRREQFERFTGGTTTTPLRASGAWLYTAVVAPFLEFFMRRFAIPILLFALLYKLGDALAGNMTTPFILKIGFSKVELAEVAKLYGFAATMIGVALGGLLIRAVGLLRGLMIAGILQLTSNLMFAVQAWYGYDINVLILTISAENLAGGMGTAAFVAYLSSLCNVAYTATQYALLSSFMAGGRTLLSSPAGWMIEHLNWAGAWTWVTGTAPPDDVALQVNWIGFFILTTLAAIPGLVVLLWLMHRQPQLAERDETAATTT